MGGPNDTEDDFIGGERRRGESEEALIQRDLEANAEEQEELYGGARRAKPLSRQLYRARGDPEDAVTKSPSDCLKKLVLEIDDDTEVEMTVSRLSPITHGCISTKRRRFYNDALAASPDKLGDPASGGYRLSATPEDGQMPTSPEMVTPPIARQMGVPGFDADPKMKKQKKKWKGFSRKTLRRSAANLKYRNGVAQVLRPGDIMRVNRSVIDHVLLVVEPPKSADVIDAVSDGHCIGVCHVTVIECASNLSSPMLVVVALVVDPTDDLIKCVKQSDPTDIAFWEPVSLFLAPFTSKELDYRVFSKVVDQVLDEEVSWSKVTAVRAAAAGVGIMKPFFDENDYLNDPGGERLLQEVRDCWAEAPICTTIPIRVWQMYMLEIAESAAAGAAQILRWMPVKCDRCLPSDLWQVLRKTRSEGWMEIAQVCWTQTVPVAKEGVESMVQAYHSVDSVKKKRCWGCCLRRRK